MDDNQIDGLDIIMDNSTEYQTLGVLNKYTTKWCIHCAEEKDYHVNSVEGIGPEESRIIRMLDVMPSIVIICRENYLECRNTPGISKRDFVIDFYQ